MGGVLDDPNEVLDRLAGVELSDSESVVELHRMLARLDAVTTVTVGRTPPGASVASS